MKRVVWVIASALILASQPSPLMAQSAKKKVQQPQEFEVYLRNLEAKKTDCEELVNTELNPQRSEIRKTFAKTVGQLEDHLVALRQDPTDKSRQAAYEETLSLAITQAMGFLGNYHDLESKAMRRLGEMKTALTEARQACIEQEKASKKKAAEYQERAESIRKQLALLAEKYAHLFDSGGELPAEVALDVRLLEADAMYAEQSAQFAGIAQQDMKLTAADLQDQLYVLSDATSGLKVSFRQAAGQRMLLSQVASIKERRLTAKAMRSRLGAFAQLAAGLSEDSQQVDRLFLTLFKDGRGQSETSKDRKPTRRVSSEQGLAILKRYANRSSNGKEVSDEKSVVNR